MTTTGTRSPPTWLELADAPAIAGLRFRRARRAEADYEAIAEVMSAANRADEIPWSPVRHQPPRRVRGSGRVRPDGSISSSPRSTGSGGDRGGRPGASGRRHRLRDRSATSFPTGAAVAWVGRCSTRTCGASASGRSTIRRARRRCPHLRRRDRDRPPDPAGDRGSRPIRWFFEMRRPTLDDIPDAPLPDGLEIRPVTPDLHRTIWEADTEAFQDHWGARRTGRGGLRVDLRQHGHRHRTCGSWPGPATRSPAWSSHGSGRTRTRRSASSAGGWSTSASGGRGAASGSGARLTAEGLRRLRAAGMTDAMLGVDADNPTGALGLYEVLGFEVHTRARVRPEAERARRSDPDRQANSRPPSRTRSSHARSRPMVVAPP